MASKTYIKDYMSCIVNHYVKTHYLNLNDEYKIQYVISLNGIIAKFLGNILFRFNIATKSETIQENGCIFSTKCVDSINSYVNGGCSFETGRYNSINEFKIKIKSNPNSNSAIGITTNLKNCKSTEWMYEYENAETYYVANSKYGTGTAWTGINNKFKRSTGAVFRPPSWEVGDVITMTIDCTDKLKWYLIYKYNEKEVGKFDIAPNLIYYPCICTSYKNQEYEVVL
eukprot:331755_1